MRMELKADIVTTQPKIDVVSPLARIPLEWIAGMLQELARPESLESQWCGLTRRPLQSRISTGTVQC